MPEKLLEKLTEEQIQWLLLDIERRMSREDEQKIEDAERRALRNAIIEKMVAGSVWGIISFFVMKIVNKYW